MNEDVMY